MNLLIVEDDANLRYGISFSFERDGYNVICADTAKSGMECFNSHRIDLIILDLNLPDGNGIDLCKTIRRESCVPILMLTARDLETDEVMGLMAGADDYITKPFSLSVLRARVQALLRRTAPKQIQSGRYRIDTSTHNVYRDGMEIAVSVTEYKLLSYFVNNPGQVLTKEQLLSELWDKQGNFVDENTLAVNISRLRSKIEDDPRTPQTLKTVHGLGYIWINE